MLTVVVASVGAVALAVVWRVANGWPVPLGPRLGAIGAIVVVPTVIAAWTVTGPLESGWARRAGTPSSLLASSGSTSGGAGPSSASPTAPAGAFGQTPFTATLQGTHEQSAPDEGGIVTDRIDATLKGDVAGQLVITIQGRAARTEGVDLATSTVTIGPPQHADMFTGKVTDLEGARLTMTASSAQGATLTLAARLQLPESSDSVGGVLRVTPGAASGSPDGGGSD